MIFADFLHPDSVLVPLTAADREAALTLLVDVLPLPGGAADRAMLQASLQARESAGSTGIGNGVAIPHARSSNISTPLLAVGLARTPIDFKSADGKPVSLVFLLAVPDSAPSSHLKTLAALSRLALDKKFLSLLKQASYPDELYNLLAPNPI